MSETRPRPRHIGLILALLTAVLLSPGCQDEQEQIRRTEELNALRKENAALGQQLDEIRVELAEAERLIDENQAALLARDNKERARSRKLRDMAGQTARGEVAPNQYSGAEKQLAETINRLLSARERDRAEIASLNDKAEKLSSGLDSVMKINALQRDRIEQLEKLAGVSSTQSDSGGIAETQPDLFEQLDP